jgi:signal transduction histidine kinase
MERKRSDGERINEFIKAIIRVAQGDFSVQLKLTGENNILDSLAMGLNIMIDELRNSVEIELQNEKFKKINAELLLAKEKAEESDRLKSAFLANMSHEIRTPMNGILGFASLLKKPQLSGEQQLKFIQIIEKSGERMLNIINDLIEISRIEAGQIMVTKTPTNINEQMEFIYAFFKPEVEEKGMQIHFERPLPFENLVVDTDNEKLYAILINLVKNAIKYSIEGTILFGYKKKRGYLEFYVKDTGIGIAREQLTSVFDRFVQSDNNLNSSFEGAGLGLSISKAYVEMLGGEIWAESDSGKGSQFFFTLPCGSRVNKDALPYAEKSVITNEYMVKKMKILIADDNEDAQMLLMFILGEISCDIISAKTGIEAVEKCRKEPDIDLILMDIKMPKMDGYESVKQIRQFNKSVIIIAQTAFAQVGDRAKAIEAGCNDYTTKPIIGEVLMDIIRKHMKL